MNDALSNPFYILIDQSKLQDVSLKLSNYYKLCRRCRNTSSAATFRNFKNENVRKMSQRHQTQAQPL